MIKDQQMTYIGKVMRFKPYISMDAIKYDTENKQTYSATAWQSD